MERARVGVVPLKHRVKGNCVLMDAIFHCPYCGGQTSHLERCTKTRFNKSNQVSPPVFLIGIHLAREANLCKIIHFLLVYEKVGKQLALLAMSAPARPARRDPGCRLTNPRLGLGTALPCMRSPVAAPEVFVVRLH